MHSLDRVSRELVAISQPQLLVEEDVQDSCERIKELQYCFGIRLNV